VLEEIGQILLRDRDGGVGRVGVQTRIIATYAAGGDQAAHIAGGVQRRMPARDLHDRARRRHRRRKLQDHVDRVGNRLKLNGVKTLISRAEEAGMFVVFTRVDKKPGRRRIGCVLVEKGTPRFSVTGTYHTMGGEICTRSASRMSNCRPEKPGAGRRVPQTAQRVQHPRCLNPSISLGLAEGRSKRRSNTPRSAVCFRPGGGGFQGMRWKIAEMYREVERAQRALPPCASAGPVPRPRCSRRSPR